MTAMDPNMSKEAARVLSEALEERSDFRGRCVKCSKDIVGSLQMMRDHECEDGEETDEEGQ